MRYISLSAFALMTGVGAAAWAEALPPENNSLSAPDARKENNKTILGFDDALMRAAAMNPDVTAQVYRERAAEALTEQADVRPNPELGVTFENFAGSGPLRDAEALEATVELSQTIERGDKRKHRVHLADKERTVISKEGNVRRASLMETTAGAYLELLAIQQRIELAAEPLALAEKVLSAAQERVKAAVASPAELARARASVVLARSEIARLKSEEKSARMALAALWGGTADDFVSVSGRLRIDETLPEIKTFSEKLLNHPGLAMQEALIESRRASVKLEEANAVQDISMGLGVRYFNEDSDVALVAGISIPLPFWDNNGGNIRSARENLSAAREEAKLTAIDLKVNLARAWQEMASAHATAVSLREEALPAMEEAHTMVLKAYEAGQTALIEVLDSQSALIAVRRELLELELAYALALCRLCSYSDGSFEELSKLIKQ